MMNAEQMAPHETREALYHEALENFISTSAGYMELEIPEDLLTDTAHARVLAIDVRDLL